MIDEILREVTRLEDIEAAMRVCVLIRAPGVEVQRAQK